ncbi:MAG: adenylate/guanylate cyclase domain-containing protein [Deltaproteobacteria bacterium]|nr:adenylate/guanylate cyclase domain-containing protein [Deltaproteobacteria bacterium]
MNKRLVFALFGVIAAFCTFMLYKQANPTLQQLDFRMKDARFRIRGPVKPDKDVVVVAIDHKSIKEIGRWPWSREVTGQLIENLGLYYGTRVTALDIVFSEPQNQAADAALAASVKKAGNAVMGYFFREEQSVPQPESLAQLENAKLKLVRVADGVQNIPIQEFPSLDLNIPSVGAGALDFGFFNARPDADGLYRRSILLLLYNGDIYPSLAMKALRHYLGSEIMLDVKQWGVDSMQIGQLRVPAREDGTMALNFYGPTGSFTTVSAADVINRRLPKESLKGRIAFVGATEIGIYDLRPTPFDATLPGIEIHATMAANALERRFLLYDGVTQQYEMACIIILPILLGCLLAFAPGTFAGLGVLAVVTAGFGAFNYAMFASAFRDMTLIYPFLGIALTYLGSEAWRNLVVERKGRHLKKAFSSYVSPDLVKQIEKDPDKLVLGGEQRELTILFSDIRGFTTVSESLTPPELVKLLNEYLSPMTRIVLEERGTLDKFIGDAVMALFNAPLDVPEHASHACSAAVRMMEKLKDLNEGFAARGMNTLDIGVGINTGPAVVGNMGADIRFDYTAIGDSVNLASRLEGLNKYYASHILVSEDTRSQVSDGRFTFREVDRVRVKGKHQPIVMYELMIANMEILPRFEEGLTRYRSQEFSAAREIFEELAEGYNDGPSRLYAGRCAEYIENPPPAEWDGVYTAKSK